MINVERHTLEENGGASYLLSVESNKTGIGQEARVVVCPPFARGEEDDLSVECQQISDQMGVELKRTGDPGPLQ